MRNILRLSWLKVAFVILFLWIYLLVNGYIDRNYTNHFNYGPRITWMYIWTFLLGAYFASDHLRSWLFPGKIRIDYGYLIIAIICAFLNFYGFILLNLVFGNFVPFLCTLFWNALICTFYKEPACNDQEKI